MTGLPHARWALAVAARSGGLSPVTLNDAETVVGAVRAGLGRALLPRIVGKAEPGLRWVTPLEGAPPLPTREVWLLMHPDLRPLARVAIVADWLAQLFSRPPRSAPLCNGAH